MARASYMAMTTSAGRNAPREATITSPTPRVGGGSPRNVPVSDQSFAHPVRVLGVRDFMVVSGPLEQRIAAIAAAQRGRVARHQLEAIGMTPRMIRTRVSRGSLHVVQRAVYAVGHPGRVELGDETAALLACGDRSLLTHRSAVWLWKLARQAPDEVDVTTLEGRHGKTRPGIRVHRSDSLTPDQTTIYRGLPVTRPARALLELADVAGPRELELALDEALAIRATSRTKLHEQLERVATGRHGASVLAALLDPGRATSVTRSEAEERLRAMILAAGLQVPEMQAPLLGFTGDFYWREAAYVVEFDSYAFHSSRRAWRRDRTKDRVFAAHGILLDRFTWEDISERPLATIAHITQQVTARTLQRAASAGTLR